MSDNVQVTTEAGRSDEGLVAELIAKARAEGIELVGENGLLRRLTKTTLENVLLAEMDEHLELEVPRDRDGSFAPQVVRKRQRRLTGVDGLVLSLSARGLTHGEICAHLAEVYGANVSKQSISAITDSVIERWPTGPTGPSIRCIPSCSWMRCT